MSVDICAEPNYLRVQSENPMKSTVDNGSVVGSACREKDGEFGPDGLGPDVSWFAENWQTVCDLVTRQAGRPPVIYDQSVGLMALVRSARGRGQQLGNINRTSLPERFLLKGPGCPEGEGAGCAVPGRRDERRDRGASEARLRSLATPATSPVSSTTTPKRCGVAGLGSRHQRFQVGAHPGGGYVDVPYAHKKGAARAAASASSASRSSAPFRLLL